MLSRTRWFFITDFPIFCHELPNTLYLDGVAAKWASVAKALPVTSRFYHELANTLSRIFCHELSNTVTAWRRSEQAPSRRRGIREFVSKNSRGTKEFVKKYYNCSVRASQKPCPLFHLFHRRISSIVSRTLRYLSNIFSRTLYNLDGVAA